MSLLSTFAGGAAKGELRQFSDISELPATWAQASGASQLSSVLSTSVVTMQAPADSTAGLTVWAIESPQGLRSVWMSGTVVAQALLDENTGTWNPGPTSHSAFAAFRPQPPACFPCAGGFIVAGGASNGIALTAAVRFDFATNSFSSIANVPYGGYAGGHGATLVDGRSVWIPGLRIVSGGYNGVNPDSWLFYNQVLNEWTVEVHAGSIPQGANYQNSGQATTWGGSDFVKAGGVEDVFFALTSAASSMIKIDVSARTFTLIARPGSPTNMTTSGSAPAWLAASATGVWYMQANVISFQSYNAKTGIWSTVNFWNSQPGHKPSQLANGSYRGKAYKLASGLHYLSNTGTVAQYQTASFLYPGDYTPGGSVWARKT